MQPVLTQHWSGTPAGTAFIDASGGTALWSSITVSIDFWCNPRGERYGTTL